MITTKKKKRNKRSPQKYIDTTDNSQLNYHDKLKDLKNFELHSGNFYEEAKTIFRKMKTTRHNKLEEINNMVNGVGNCEIGMIDYTNLMTNDMNKQFFTNSNNLLDNRINYTTNLNDNYKKKNIELENEINILRKKYQDLVQENKLNNNHAVLLVNEEIGLIEMFYEIQSKQYAVVQL